MAVRTCVWTVITAAVILFAVNSCARGDDPVDGGPDSSSDSGDDGGADTDTAGTDSVGDTDDEYHIVDLSSCGGLNCAVFHSGNVKCWGAGNNVNGTMGYSTLEEACTGNTPDTCPFVDVGAGVDSVSTGGGHTCVVVDEGGVKCWGFDGGGQYACSDILGYGPEYDCGECDVPADWGILDLGFPASRVSATSSHTLALLEDGDVIAWGCAGTSFPSHAYEGGFMDFGGKAVQVSAGCDFHCVLVDSGDVYCWGYNQYGQLGYAHTNDVAPALIPNEEGPVDLPGRAILISSGCRHTCAVLEDGDVVCWGSGVVGQLGYGNTECVGDDEHPAEAGTVDLGGTAMQVAAGGSGGNGFTCVVLEGGNVKCWGAILNEYGQVIGDDESPSTMGAVEIGGTATMVSGGSSHACVLLDNGHVRCWGENSGGELGYGHTEDIGDDETPASAGDVPLF